MFTRFQELTRDRKPPDVNLPLLLTLSLTITHVPNIKELEGAVECMPSEKQMFVEAACP